MKSIPVESWLSYFTFFLLNEKNINIQKPEQLTYVLIHPFYNKTQLWKNQIHAKIHKYFP